MTNAKQRIENYIKSWELRGYPSGIPDEAPAILEELGKVPSYRLICIALMKNEKNLESLGFSRMPCRLYMAVKRDELLLKGKIRWTPQQPRLF